MAYLGGTPILAGRGEPPARTLGGTSDRIRGYASPPPQKGPGT